MIKLPRRRRSSLRAFSTAIAVHGWRDPGQMVELCLRVGRALKLTPAQMRDLEDAVHVCDIGLSAVPYSLLRSGYEDESHPATGAEIVSRIPSLSHLAEIVRLHHAPHTESDPPPIEARVIRAVDTYVSDGLDAVLSGSGFCPLVVDALSSVLTSGDGGRKYRGRS